MASNGKQQGVPGAKARVNIRVATPSDAEAIVGLVKALAAHVGDESQATITPQAMAEAGSSAHPLWRGVVAEASDRMVGICLYSILYSTWIGSPGLYVIDLYVEPDFRDAQLGRRLLAEAARQGREFGCRFIRLDVDHRNGGVEGFYEQIGFVRREGDSIFILKPDRFDMLAGS